MKLLLDTHILLGLIGKRTDSSAPEIQRLLEEPAAAFVVSVASLWEIASSRAWGNCGSRPAWSVFQV